MPESPIFVHSADLSPDGQRVAWAAQWAEGPADRVELRISTVGEPGFRAVEHGSRDTDPAWSPDGRRIAFVSDHSGTPQIHLLDADSGKVVRVAETTVVQGPVWSPDGGRLAWTAPSHPPRDPGAPYRVTRAVPWADGIGLIDDALTDIFTVEVETGEVTRLTDDDLLNRDPVWGPGGITYVASFPPGEPPPADRVRTVTPEGRITEHGPVVADVALARPLADGRVLHGSMALLHPASDGDLRITGPGGTRSLTEGLGLDLHGCFHTDTPSPLGETPVVLADATHAVARVQRGGTLEIHRFALDGPPRSTPLVTGPRTAHPIALRAGRLLHTSATAASRPDLYVTDVGTGEETRVTFLAGEPVHTVERLDVRSADGTGIEGWFLRPAGATAPYPTVLMIHGGPHAAYGEVFNADAHRLADHGYGVLMINPRGSRGYGPEFTVATVGAWGESDFPDFMAAVDHAVGKGLADPDRLGVCGLSYGGYMTCWITGHTDRFRAAVAENPATNLHSLYGTSDLGVPLLNATMGTSAQRLAECSPLTHAHRSTTPTLLVVADQDHRCPPEQARQYYTALTTAGCPAELLILPGAGHEASVSGPPAVREAQDRALVEWMDRHLGERPC
ncbi:prolyl oligopeptidase family serine peptidase [Streptomyces sp. NPDC051018]|uniref:S9 family peptidase n=1 Tax=Streptomyces sp. NPDC051018 TaxID=3365639 RepID=UPI00378A6F2E